MPFDEYQRYIYDERRKRRMKRLIWEIVVSVLLLMPAIILSLNIESLVYKLLIGKVTLKPDSEGYKNWLNPPISTTRKYYLFNITNPLEIVKDPNNKTIRFQDSPAYSYNIKTKKLNPKWSENKQTISYGVERLYTRDPTFDPTSVNDTGVFIDMLRAMFRTQYKEKIPADSFYNLGGKNPFYYGNAVDLLEGSIPELHKTMKDHMYGPNTDKSGFIYRQNGSRLYNVSIKSDISIKGQVLTFGSELVPFNITSSNYTFPIYDSLTYPVNLSEHKTLNIFNSDFCKPVLIQYNRTVKMFGGVDMYEYKLKLVDYANCSDPTDPRTCDEVDKIDVSKCISTSIPENTIFLSKAHFYGASNETISNMNVQGYSPTAEQHDSALYFEPITGTPFQANYRMQLNVDVTLDPMNVGDDNQIVESAKKRCVKRLVPVFWIDQDIKLDDALINKLRKALIVRQYGPKIVIPLAIALVVIIIIVIEIFGRRADRCIQFKYSGYTIADS